MVTSLCRVCGGGGAAGGSGGSVPARLEQQLRQRSRSSPPIGCLRAEPSLIGRRVAGFALEGALREDLVALFLRDWNSNFAKDLAPPLLLAA
jgi:hypothetical protein